LYTWRERKKIVKDPRKHSKQDWRICKTSETKREMKRKKKEGKQCFTFHLS
jgi:hypothetical protein